VIQLIDRLRKWTTAGKILSIALAIVLLPWVVQATDNCTQLPDLWLPPNGLEGLADGKISIQTTTGDVCQGTVIEIKVTVHNLSCGDAEAFDVSVYYDNTSNIIGTQTVAGLPGCEYTELTFIWDTNTAPTGEHDILVCVDTGMDVPELNEDNNCLTIETDLLIRPLTPYIEVEKTAVDTNGGTVLPGDTIRYEVTIWNYGCANLEDNPAGHEFTDVLPAGIAATGQTTATSGTADVEGNTIVWDGSIPAGDSVTITYRVDVDGDLETGTQICNQGIVHWDSNGDGTIDSKAPTDDRTTSDPACITVEEPVGPPPLSGTIDAPTLSQWGMILSSCLFALAFAWHGFWRRRVSAI